MGKHTKLPWAIYPNPMRSDGVFVGTDEHTVEQINRLGYVEERGRAAKWICGAQVSPEDGELIVRACNSHYELVEALRKALEDTEDGLHQSPCSEPDCWVEKAKAALAKAQPGENRE